MLNTDLKGLWDNCKNNKIIHLLLLLGVCIFLYSLLSKYMNTRTEFNNIVYLQGMLTNMQEGMNTGMNTGMYTGMYTDINNKECKKDIPRMDEAIFRNTINLPNRNPDMLTSSMVYPLQSKPSDEEKRRTRMDILNMFYNSFDDDLTCINARPQNLYIIP